MLDNIKYMKLAIKEAEKAKKRGDIPVGAVIVKDNKVIAKAYNKKEFLKSSVAHAEILAIRKAQKKLVDWRLDNCSIYVTLEPCLMCLGAIMSARIPNIYVGALRHGKYNYKKIIDDNDLNYKIKKYECGILLNECEMLLTNFFKGDKGE